MTNARPLAIAMPGLVAAVLVAALPLLRQLGIRTRGEIDREKHALQDALQGA